MRRLTAKQEKFCIKYVECGNASEAYRFSYSCKKMKDHVVWVKASELLKVGKVAVRVKELQQEIADKLLISETSILTEYARIGLSDIRDLFDKDGLKNIVDLGDNIAKAVSSFKVVTKSVGHGEVEYVSEVKLWPKVPALEALAKNLGLLSGNGEKTEDPSGVNITFVVADPVGDIKVTKGKS